MQRRAQHNTKRTKGNRNRTPQRRDREKTKKANGWKTTNTIKTKIGENRDGKENCKDDKTRKNEMWRRRKMQRR